MTWEQAWREGRTGWDTGASPPVLRQLTEEGQIRTGCRALVPGCGSGHDVFTLAQAGCSVVGLDIAPSAKAQFETLRAQRGLSPDRAEIVLADFFDYTPAEPFDLIWDYTFLCALEPTSRTAWANRIDRLLATDGELITLIFPVDPVPLNPGGPPYPMTPQLVTKLLEPTFRSSTLTPVKRSHPARQGKEWLGRWQRRRP